MFYWKAIYKDGQLSQFNEDGSENRYDLVDRSRLCRFELCPMGTDKPLISIRVDRPTQQVFRRERVFKTVGVQSGKVLRQNRVYIIGIRERVNGDVKVRVAYVFPDRVEWRDGFDGSALYKAPLWNLEEEV
jgi:hypothetical protein